MNVQPLTPNRPFISSYPLTSFFSVHPRSIWKSQIRLSIQPQRKRRRDAGISQGGYEYSIELEFVLSQLGAVVDVVQPIFFGSLTSDTHQRPRFLQAGHHLSTWGSLDFPRTYKGLNRLDGAFFLSLLNEALIVRESKYSASYVPKKKHQKV